MINIDEEYMNQVSGMSTSQDKIKLEERFWNLSQIDSIATKLQAQQLEIYNNINKRYTENKTIMDYYLQYTLSVEVRRSINYIRLFKRAYLLLEIVGENGKKISNYYIKQDKCSMIMWKYKIKINTPPSNSQWRHQKRFIQWLRE